MGVFIGLKVSKEDFLKIKKFQEGIELSNPVKEEDIHCTLFATKDNFDYCNQLNYLPLEISNLKIGKIKTQKGIDCLALFFDSEVLQNRHNDIKKEYQVEPFYPDLKLHITLSYDCGQIEIENINLENYMKHIKIDYEYVHELRFEINRRMYIRD